MKLIAAVLVSAALLASTVRGQIVGVRTDSAMAEFFTNVRARQFDHKDLPDLETLFCLYGTVSDDIAYVEMVKPIKIIGATSRTLQHDNCPIPLPYIGVKYLGTWHTHNTHGAWNECMFSDTDQRSFAADAGPIMMITCARGTQWTARKH